MDQKTLNEMDVEELLDVCDDRNITGVDKQPKDVLINIILNDMVEENGIPTKEELMAKTAAELRELLADRGINGLEKQPKPLLVDILLNDYAKAILTGVQATVTVTKDENGKVSSKISVSCGGSQDDFDVVGHTVSDVADLLREVLNIPETPVANVNGSSVILGYVLQDGDVLDFVQKADKKG